MAVPVQGSACENRGTDGAGCNSDNEILDVCCLLRVCEVKCGSLDED